MLPMISGVSEVDELKMLIKRAHDELLEGLRRVDAAHRRHDRGAFGGLPDRGAGAARRFRVGRNQRSHLVILAVDRNNSRVAELYDDLHPAVLRALKQVVAGARVFNRPVICGEMAGNPIATVLRWGVDSLSMSAGSLMKVKWVVRSFSVSRATQLLHALRMEMHWQVRRFMGALDDARRSVPARPLMSNASECLESVVFDACQPYDGNLRLRTMIAGVNER